MCLQRSVYIAVLALTLHACGGGSASTNTEPSGTPVPTITPEPTPTSTAEPTATPTPTPMPTATPTSTPEPSPTPEASTGARNVLLIIADDMGVDASAQYSYSTDLPNTPTLNSLAESGLTFDNLWATPACTTTRGTLITGDFGINTGVSYVPAVLSTSTTSLQDYLKSQPDSANYQTAVIGKWHLGGANPDLNHPSELGVDYYAGSIAGTIDDYYNWELVKDGTTTTSTTYHTSAITDIAIDWLAEQVENNSPWFLWLAYVAPHSPFHLPPAELHTNTALTGEAEHIESNRRDYYLAAIEAMDNEINRLISRLPPSQRENTLIIFIGDNGTPAGVIDTAVFPRSHSKGSLYEGGIRVPMIVSGSGVERTGERESALVNTTDIFATLISAASTPLSSINNSHSFFSLLSDNQANTNREYNYAEFESDDLTAWTVRNDQYKLIEFSNGDQEFYDLSNSIRENNLIESPPEEVKASLVAYGESIRSAQDPIEDITDAILSNRSANCADYVNLYRADARDVNRNIEFEGSLTIQLDSDKCIFTSNNIPNHDFNDTQSFPNNVSEQSQRFEITSAPSLATSTTALSLRTDNAVLLNGVKVDLLAAGCYGVGDGKTGCNDLNQPWRYDPVHPAAGFRVDSHNAHSQANGSYHYHGHPKTLYAEENPGAASPVIGFAADGFPIYGPYINANGTIRKAISSYRLKSGSRPEGNGDPGGSYDGSFRDDYEFIDGLGDLDVCNGMSVNGIYGYYLSDGYPYILGCFSGTPDNSFNK